MLAAKFQIHCIYMDRYFQHSDSLSKLLSHSVIDRVRCRAMPMARVGGQGWVWYGFTQLGVSYGALFTKYPNHGPFIAQTWPSHGPSNWFFLSLNPYS